MRIASLITLVSALTLSVASAATVTFSTGGNFTLFQTSAGDPLEGGYLHAGHYASDPVGLSTTDLRDNFVLWATHGNTSGAGNGFFGNGDFPVTDVGASAGQSLYLVVTDTASIVGASQIAVFTNMIDADWNFPATDLGFTPSVSLDDIVLDASGSSILAGVESTSALTGGGPSIQLAAIPEPSISLLALLGVAGLIRRRR